MSIPVLAAEEAVGDGWKAIIFPSRIVVAIDPQGDNLPRALRELLHPIDMQRWATDWVFEDQAGWNVYHVERL